MNMEIIYLKCDSVDLRADKKTCGGKKILILLTCLLLGASTNAQQLKIGDHYAGGIIFRVDNSGSDGWIVTDGDLRDSITYNDAIKMCDTIHIGGKTGWKISSLIEWGNYNR